MSSIRWYSPRLGYGARERIRPVAAAGASNTESTGTGRDCIASRGSRSTGWTAMALSVTNLALSVKSIRVGPLRPQVVCRADAVATLRLGPIHRLVGRVEQSLAVEAVDRIGRHADADREPDR